MKQDTLYTRTIADGFYRQSEGVTNIPIQSTSSAAHLSGDEFYTDNALSGHLFKILRWQKKTNEPGFVWPQTMDNRSSSSVLGVKDVGV